MLTCRTMAETGRPSGYIINPTGRECLGWTVRAGSQSVRRALLKNDGREVDAPPTHLPLTVVIRHPIARLRSAMDLVRRELPGTSESELIRSLLRGTLDDDLMPYFASQYELHAQALMQRRVDSVRWQRLEGSELIGGCPLERLNVGKRRSWDVDFPRLPDLRTHYAADLDLWRRAPTVVREDF